MALKEFSDYGKRSRNQAETSGLWTDETQLEVQREQ